LPKPLQVLLALLEHPGELVTREHLVALLWPSGTFVDFDDSLNKAVNKLREALGDSAEAPTFIETLPRRGYRLIARWSMTRISPAMAASRPTLARDGRSADRVKDSAAREAAEEKDGSQFCAGVGGGRRRSSIGPRDGARLATCCVD
jgi:DNA-binding winged helix-turn-helix (wHTH) protein